MRLAPPPACRRPHPRGLIHRIPAGFSLIELIAVLVLIGALAVVVLPRVNIFESLRGEAWREQVVAGLRLAQVTASSHRRLVCADLVGSRLQLRVASANPATACDTTLPGPDGSAYFSEALSAGSAAVTPAGPLYFQPAGTVSLDGAGSSPADRSISGGDAPAITVYGRSGHVE